MTTNYDKWNKVKLEDLGWTEEDEAAHKSSSAITQEKLAQHHLEDNAKKISEAKKALAAAKAEQAKLRKLSAELAVTQAERDSAMMWISVSVMLVVTAGIMIANWFPELFKSIGLFQGLK